MKKRPFPSKKRPHPTPHARRPLAEKPSASVLGDKLRYYGIDLPTRELSLLWRFHNLLRTRNEDRDLTRIIAFDAVVLKHYVDCMMVGDLTTLPSPLLDVGTGAGFPGIPLKIRYPHLKMTLAEPRPNRVRFLRDVITELGLKDIEVFEHKVSSRSFQMPVAGVITRAVETVDKTLLRTSSAVGIGGRVYFMKGPHCDDEIQEAKRRLGDAYFLERDKPYRLPKSSHERRLLIYRRVSMELKDPGEA